MERELIGGECAYYACLPSKALLPPGEILAEARRIPGAAEAIRGPLDAQAVLDRRDEVIHDLDDSANERFLATTPTVLYRGQGALPASGG